ncbi:MAG: sugar nucleotide-binding protein [Patescibacteria group bacterium]
MKTSEILMIGGSGLLGREILKLAPDIVAPDHKKLDILDGTSIYSYLRVYEPKIVLHLAAATNPPQHEKDPIPGITVNITGTANIARMCYQSDPAIKLIYVSTDYVYHGKGPHLEDEPVKATSRFILSKLGGECVVQMLPRFLILRLSFGPVPFPWENVYEGQWNSKLYVDEIAPFVLKAVLSDAEGIMNIGGPRTTLEAYARRTRPNIETISKPLWVPDDTSMDLTRMKKTLCIDDEAKFLKRR